MNENINLCKILKGHEGETFYSPTFGDSKLNIVSDYIGFESIYGCVSFNLLPYGNYCETEELCIFPSKDQRDWNKWLEEQEPKVPKIWSELCKAGKAIRNIAQIDSEFGHFSDTVGKTPIEKSALALLKIHQLIEVGYGGNVNHGWCITVKDGRFGVYETIYTFSPFAFHTKEQAEEFFSKPENVQLLKDYFMI